MGRTLSNYWGWVIIDQTGATASIRSLLCVFSKNEFNYFQGLSNKQFWVSLL